jgi:tRNA pseudouridine38-40 synthase
VRIVLGVEYNGSNYHGWQAQQGLVTVQAVVEQALSQLSDHQVRVFCAGRTDAGVHASGQVVHFDTQAERKLLAWVNGANAYLPSTVAVLWAKKVDDSFHARFTALARRYCYIIFNHRVRPALLADRVSWYPYALNIAAMQEASQYFLGEQDFTSIRSAECTSLSAMRNITSVTITQKEPLLFINVEANAFLHHMVRNLVGVLLHIGRSRVAPSWAKDILQAKDRRHGAITAPAQGLYLQKVSYPEHYQLPKQLDNQSFAQFVTLLCKR